MKNPAHERRVAWTPSAYYAESLVDCKVEKAWGILLDYPAWNPTFAGAQVTLVSGNARSEGEIVLIKKSLADVNGEPLTDFYAETVKVVPNRHIAWYVYPKEGESFRNFVDFGLTQMASGVKFDAYYYEQNKLSGELLAKQRHEVASMLCHIAIAFKNFCEAKV